MRRRRRPVSFRLSVPGGKGGFYEVIIRRDKREMHLFAEELARRNYTVWGSLITGRRWLGICAYRDLRERRDGKYVRVNRRGVVMLCRTHFGVGIVTHELAHAAHYWLLFERNMKPGSRRWDEEYASLIGELARRFWVRYYKLAGAA